jgi:RNA polymerase sigma factor (sigma-70 family)
MRTHNRTDQAVLRAFQQLTKEERQVLALRLWDGLDSREIARRMNKPHREIKQIQLRALRSLHQILEEAQ